jgi:type IV pilus assembly protein PilA
MAQGFPGPGGGPPQGYGPQGYGPQQGYGPPGYGPPGYGPGVRPPSSSSSTLIIILVVVGFVVVGIGVFAALAIHGMNRFLQSAKTAEAKNTLNSIARSAQSAYERENFDDPLMPSGTAKSKHELCPSWKHPIPNEVPSGRKVAPSSADFEDPAVKCLRFEIYSPTYYQYNYEKTSDGFVVTATGDLDANGKQSHFKLKGTVSGGTVKIAPQIEEIDPDE